MVSSMLTKFDAWFGRAIMHPPIVWLCQRTGSSQYAIASYAWMLAAWTLIMRLTFNGFGEWVWAILIVVVALFETSFAATNPDRPRPSSAGLRMLVLVFVLIDLIQFAMHSEHNGFHGFNWGARLGRFCVDRRICKEDPNDTAAQAIASKVLYPRSQGMMSVRSRGKYELSLYS